MRDPHVRHLASPPRQPPPAPCRPAPPTQLAAIADLERDALSRLSASQIAGYHAVISALQEAC